MKDLNARVPASTGLCWLLGTGMRGVGGESRMSTGWSGVDSSSVWKATMAQLARHRLLGGRPAASFKNVQCVGETEILVEQQPPQGVFLCDHAGPVINQPSRLN